MITEDKIVFDVIEEKGKPLRAILPEAHFIDDPQKKFDGTTGAIPEEESQNNLWAAWGYSDCLPTIVREKIEKVAMASAAINKLVAMMYGNGLIYYNNKDLHDGNTTVKRAYSQEVENFLTKNRIHTNWLPAQLADYRYYMNCFSEFITSRDRKKIVGLSHKPAEFCRLAKQDLKTLKINKVFFSPYFAQGYSPSKEKMAEIPFLEPQHYYFDENYFSRISRKYKVAWHSKFPTPGITYYARPFWIGLFRDKGWLDISINVPEIITAMQNNQVSLKYQILIPVSYFKVRHAEWDTYTFAKKESLIKALRTKINDMLSGTDNQFKSITTVFLDDPQFSTPQGKIEIIAIDDKAKKGTWVPDSNAADAQIVQGLGLHPSQIGLAPEGGKMGAGSGSDQRESYNTQIQINTIDQQIILEPLNFISEFNKWGVTFAIDHSTHTTTNVQESGIVPSGNTLTIES